ncbi:hypothetical protein HPB49_024380 [Dermacentor silvarum]|uniref:Uncharacterized protein n=1 Tax=Dermacentor silvarum TaxID=543639 RepID=A0ACB8DHN6_DERSI|nr:hypothetical protein HPB49_024380 [Dermacentor silvarum]
MPRNTAPQQAAHLLRALTSHLRVPREPGPGAGHLFFFPTDAATHAARKRIRRSCPRASTAISEGATVRARRRNNATMANGIGNDYRPPRKHRGSAPRTVQLCYRNTVDEWAAARERVVCSVNAPEGNIKSARPELKERVPESMAAISATRLRTLTHGRTRLSSALPQRGGWSRVRPWLTLPSLDSSLRAAGRICPIASVDQITDQKIAIPARDDHSDRPEIHCHFHDDATKVGRNTGLLQLTGAVYPTQRRGKTQAHRNTHIHKHAQNRVKNRVKKKKKIHEIDVETIHEEHRNSSGYFLKSLELPWFTTGGKRQRMPMTDGTSPARQSSGGGSSPLHLLRFRQAGFNSAHVAADK